MSATCRPELRGAPTPQALVYYAYLALVASSIKYTKPLKFVFECRDMVISQVLDSEYPSWQPGGVYKCYTEFLVNSGYLIPLSPAVPQQGTPEAVTSSEQSSARSMKRWVLPILVVEQGT